MAADDIEQRVLAWLRKPTGNPTPEARFVLERFAPLWEVLFPRLERVLVTKLVREVQWDGRKGKFGVILDEVVIAEELARFKRGDEERASQAKPQLPKRRHARSRA